MGLYDMIDAITERQVTKTEMGDNRIFGVVVGIVAKNCDLNSVAAGGSSSGADAMDGRVCVTIPTRDAGANELKWARVVMPSSGSKWGHYFLPEVGDQVLLAFEGGNIEKPYVIGCIPKDSDQILKKSVDEDNQYKKIVTRNGNTLYFEDNKEGDGEKDKIRILTAQGGHRIELDNEKKMILLSDQDGSNLIRMKTEDGQMEITAQKKLTIKVGDNIELILNGSNGAVSLKASKINIEASGNMDVKSNSAMKLQAGNLSVEANASLKLSSNGPASLAGTPIKLG